MPEVELEPASPVQIDRWLATSRLFVVDTPGPAKATLRLAAYPAWKAEVNGQPVPLAAGPMTGQAVISLPAGRHRALVEFTRTADRLYGTLLSAAAALLVIVFRSVFR
jgi:hypothetical protein